MSTLSLVLMLLAHLGHPKTIERAVELANVAADIASTDASDNEAALLVAICLHESNCHREAIGDGGKSRGAWQVRGRDVSAAGALAKVRWSMRVCGNLAPYAGARRCGDVPDVVASLIDPTLPRR